MTLGESAWILRATEIQPLRRRAAQAAAIVMMVAGAFMLIGSVGSLPFVPPAFGPVIFWIVFAWGVLGVLLVFFGRKLLAWGRGDET